MRRQTEARNEAKYPAQDEITIDQIHARLGLYERFATTTEVVNGIPLQVWQNQLQSLARAVLQARNFGDRDFIVHNGDRLRYSDFLAIVTAAHSALCSRGVKPGDRVAFVLTNGIPWVIAFFSAMIAGAIAVPINAALSATEVQGIIEDCDPTLIIIHRHDPERVDSTKRGSYAVLDLNDIYRLDDGKPSLRVNGISSKSTILPENIAPDDIAAIFYTSGTTGLPKGVLATHRNLISTHLICEVAEARAKFRSVGHYEMGNYDCPFTWLILTPLAHTSACAANLIPALLTGGKVVLCDYFEIESILALMERERVNGTGGVTFLVDQIISHSRLDQYDLSALRYLRFGGAACPDDLPGRIVQALPAVSPIQGYGLTETASTSCIHGGAEYLAAPLSCGPPGPVTQVTIAPPEGAGAPTADNIGEVLIRGPQVSPGYWNNPNATRETFVDGWLKTGDLGYVDTGGRLFIVGRIKDLIICAGANIYPAEIERVIDQHPSVLECAAFGRPHEVLGEEPVAIAVLHEGTNVTELELRTFARGLLANYKVPVRIFCTLEPLSRTSSGKIKRGDLPMKFATLTSQE